MDDKAVTTVDQSWPKSQPNSFTKMVAPFTDARRFSLACSLCRSKYSTRTGKLQRLKVLLVMSHLTIAISSYYGRVDCSNFLRQVVLDELPEAIHPHHRSSIQTQ
jgi:hypothetical protein